jgi:hypothetical protein
MNAAERFFAASQAGDLAGAVAQLADGVVMRNPAVDDPIVGREAVAAALAAVEAATDEFRHTHLLADVAGGPRPLHGLVFEAHVDEHVLHGVDLVELDDDDRIATFTVVSRPLAALMALGGRMGAAGAGS